MDSDEGLSEAPHQGMLFDPYTATGLKQDPLVPIERRQAAASAALGLDDVTEYRKRVLNSIGTRTGVPQANKDIELLKNSLVDSTLPTHKMEGIRTEAYLNPKRPEGGFAEQYSKKIMVGRDVNDEWVTQPARRGYKTTPSKNPIFNPKFWNWMDNNTNMDDSEMPSEQLLDLTRGGGNVFSKDIGVDVHWHNPETGETVQGEDAIEKATNRHYGPSLKVKPRPDSYWTNDYDPEKHGPYDPSDEKFVIKGGSSNESAENLRDAGFIPNLFPGESKSSKKVHADRDFPFEKRYNYYTSREINAKMHTRFVPETVEEVEIGEKRVKKKVSSIRQSTVIHEIGHKVDSSDLQSSFSHRERQIPAKYINKSYSSADPLEEGYADAYTDRYSTSGRGVNTGEMFEDVLHDPTDPTGSLTRSGYSIKSKKWKNDTHRALYTAARVAGRTGKGDRAEYADRAEVMRSVGLPHKLDDKTDNRTAELANTMALGHMLTRSPHIMKHLEHQGFGDVGRNARKSYIEQRRSHQRKTQGEQLSFDI
jgi:hypothetical protein